MAKSTKRCPTCARQHRAKRNPPVVRCDVCGGLFCYHLTRTANDKNTRGESHGICSFCLFRQVNERRAK